MRNIIIILLSALPFIGGVFAVNNTAKTSGIGVISLAGNEAGKIRQMLADNAKLSESEKSKTIQPVKDGGATQVKQEAKPNQVKPAAPANNMANAPTDKEQARKVVEFEADIMRPIPVGDSTALNLLGNVVIYHNGAVITCDSAVRYSERRMECFKRVIINQNTTYIYGDRAEYNGEMNLATVYAPIIKMVDEDATMYTYNFSFNTLDKIGIYSGGATMTQKDNLMESKRGYYYVDQREFVGVDQVELKNPDYQLRSDSIAYNMDAEVATFFTKTYIWNSKSEILSAEKGSYAHLSSDYEFTENAYIITETREIWADSIYYNSETENAVFRSNIQMREEDQKVMGFGDFGQYWGEDKNGMLTRNPSILSYDPEQPDTLYMRADSMFFYTYDKSVVFETTMPDPDVSAKKVLGYEGETLLPSPGEEVSENNAKPNDELNINAQTAEEKRQKATDLEGLVPSGNELVKFDSLDRLAKASDVFDDRGSAKKAAREAERRVKAERDVAKKAAKEKSRKAKDEERRTKALKKLKEKGGEDISDSIVIVSDTLAGIADSTKFQKNNNDSIQNSERGHLDSMSNNLNAVDSLAVTQADTTQQDTLQRVVRGYRNVRIYREDFQAVCDSLVGFSIDSTIHLYIEPVLWNGDNQIKSDIMDVYTKNQQLDRAVFRGSPFMASEVDTTMYNQIKGKVMEAFFKDNDIYRNDVKGNGQTYYYMEDDKTKDLMGFLVAECADITFLIDNRQMDKIIYRGSPVYSIYPMDKIPPTQDQFLPGFKWEAARRPMSKEDVFNRNIRPSEREYYEELPLPLFPLTESIFKDKERMIKQRLWQERNDQLSPQAQEFIRSVTVK